MLYSELMSPDYSILSAESALPYLIFFVGSTAPALFEYFLEKGSAVPATKKILREAGAVCNLRKSALKFDFKKSRTAR